MCVLEACVRAKKSCLFMGGTWGIYFLLQSEFQLVYEIVDACENHPKKKIKCAK
jgi:hypothetical protein